MTTIADGGGLKPEGGGGPGERLRFLTREELAELLQVSLRTVDALVSSGEVPCVRLRGAIVRFYLPDVLGHLTAGTAMRNSDQGPRGFCRKERKDRKENE